MQVEMSSPDVIDGFCTVRLRYHHPADDDEASNPPSTREDDGGATTDDDETPRRRRKRARTGRTITVVHASQTTLEDVGQQLWRGSLLLSDWLCHNKAALQGAVVVELGCGVGLCGVVLETLAGIKAVYLTDRDASILDVAARNLELNKHLRAGAGPACRLRELDWSAPHSQCTQNQRTTPN